VIDSQTLVVRTVALSAEIERFSEDGHVVLRALLPDTAIAEVSALLRQIRDDYNRQDPARRSEDKIGSLWKTSPDLLSFIKCSGLGDVAASLLGVNQARLIHDVYFEKWQDMKPTPWHRDSDFWPLGGGGALTFWIPLQDTPPEQALQFVSRSHKSYRISPLRRFEKALLPFHKTIARQHLALGDVTVHHYKTLHASAKYRSSRPRRTLVVHFMDAASTLERPTSDLQRGHLALSGWDALKVGDTFTDEIAPRITTPQRAMDEVPQIHE
jgi:hypothetical protein